MKNVQKVIDSLLENVPTSELATEKERSVFESIRRRLASSADVKAELGALYAVKGFSDFALGLLWIADRAEKNPEMVSATPQDETLILSLFRAAMGSAAPVQPEAAADLQADRAALESFFEQPEVSAAGVEAVTETGGFGPAEPAASLEPGGLEFHDLLEKFVEAVQSGDESRTTLLDTVLSRCAELLSGESPDDLKELCQLLTEFLEYISANQILDDVRVMNILSNVASPVADWTRASPDTRAGLLEDAVVPLRDFKSLFE